MAPKSVQTAPETPAGDPKHAARATRSAGRQMRSRLLDGASRLFKERGLAGTSISDIAAAADAFPSQITYYFRTKEALFVEAACRGKARPPFSPRKKPCQPAENPYKPRIRGSRPGAERTVSAITPSRRF